jgi:hypothetical protein
MTVFEMKLDKVLSEMPIRHFMPAGNRYEGPTHENYSHGELPYFKHKSYEGYVSPKYMQIMSEKLSRLSGYHINIFIIEGKGNNIRYNNFKIEDLAQVTGLPLSELTDAINFIMTGNNNQSEFSPWLYMHQLGEAIEKACGGLEDSSNAGAGSGVDDGWAFNDFYSGMEDLLGQRWYKNLKMGSAREIKNDEQGGYINDLHQELITEYLWHGGRIRFDYPEGVDKSEVDALLDIFYNAMTDTLNGLVGKLLVNDYGRS